jgi:Bacterial regulatory proteins, luxR family
MSASLSSREQEITSLVSAGLSNKEVARKLELTEGKIKVHLHNIFGRLVSPTGPRLPAHERLHPPGSRVMFESATVTPQSRSVRARRIGASSIASAETAIITVTFRKSQPFVNPDVLGCTYVNVA